MIGLAVTPLIVIELTKLVHRRLIADDEHPRH
jgi:hypothetical protein